MNIQTFKGMPWNVCEIDEWINVWQKPNSMLCEENKTGDDDEQKKIKMEEKQR